MKLPYIPCIELNKDSANSVFLAGVGRSGTTWIVDVINYRNEYRFIHEPFHPHRVRIVKHFEYHQYLRPSEDDISFVGPVRKILRGEVMSTWTDVYNRKLFAQRRLIKAIRANLLLKWLKEHFPEVPIIFLIRHPFAVVNSWLKLGWGLEERGTRTDIEGILGQVPLMEDYLGPFSEQLKASSSEFERHVFTWCILNYVPLKQFKLGEIHVVFYEHCCIRPKIEIERLFAFLGKDYDNGIWNVISRPSSQAKEYSAISRGTSLIDTWKKSIDEEYISRGLEILSMFGFNNVYSLESMPNAEGIRQIMKAD